MHTQRLSRHFERTVTQLREIQKTRRDQEKHDLDKLVNIIEMYEATGETYDPSDHGFVYSEQQIDAAIGARDRDRLVEAAFDHRYESAA